MDEFKLDALYSNNLFNYLHVFHLVFHEMIRQLHITDDAPGAWWSGGLGTNDEESYLMLQFGESGVHYDLVDGKPARKDVDRMFTREANEIYQQNLATSGN